jgi:hypothetical protein
MCESRRCLCSFIFSLLIILSYSTSLKGQVRSTTDFVEQNTPSPSFSIGAEGGWMRNSQSGSFQLICKCTSEDGKGNSGIGALFAEFKVNSYLAFGIKLGLDHKSTLESSTITDTATIVNFSNGSIEPGVIPVNRVITVTATYFFFAPYYKISPFGEGFFIQIAPELGILMSSNLTHTRMTNGTVTLSNGDVITNVRFQNGTQQETLQDGAITDVRNTRIALLFVAGYDIPIFGNFSIFPEASYNFPLTNISTSANDSNWKISSFALTLGLKYGI